MRSSNEKFSRKSGEKTYFTAKVLAAVATLQGVVIGDGGVEPASVGDSRGFVGVSCQTAAAGENILVLQSGDVPGTAHAIAAGKKVFINADGQITDDPAGGGMLVGYTGYDRTLYLRMAGAGSGGGGGGTMNHASLTNLDFTESGHTGFASMTSVEQSHTELQSLIDLIDARLHRVSMMSSAGWTPVVGTFVYLDETTAPKFFKEADGRLLGNATQDYPHLKKHLLLPDNARKLKTEAQWQALRTAASGTGGVPFYVLNEDADTIRMPDVRRDSMFAGVPGAWEGDATRPVVGELGRPFTHTTTYPNGPFYKMNTDGHCGGSGYAIHKIGFDNSLVVPTDTTNHPRRFAQLCCVYIGGLTIERVGKIEAFFEAEFPEGWEETNGDILYEAHKYPDLVAYLEVHPDMVKTEAQWQALRTAASGTGGVPFYVLDKVANTIRLPDTRGDSFYHGPQGWESDTMREIYGSTGYTNRMGLLDKRYPDMLVGVFKYGKFATITWNQITSNTGTAYSANLDIDSSLTVPTGATTHPRRIGMRFAVYVGTML